MQTRSKLDDTRLRVLDAAMELLAEDEANFEPGAVTLIDACRRAGLRTAGSGYRIWANQDEFRTDLMRHAVTSRPGVDQRIARMEQARDGDGEPMDRIEYMRVIGLANQTAEASEELRRHSAVWLRAHQDPEVRAGYQASQQRVVQALADSYRGVMDTYDLEMRPPYTIEHLAAAIEVQTRGLCAMTAYGDEFGVGDIRRPTGPDGSEQQWNLLGCLIEATTAAFTRPRNADPSVPPPD